MGVECFKQSKKPSTLLLKKHTNQGNEKSFQDFGRMIDCFGQSSSKLDGILLKTT